MSKVVLEGSFASASSSYFWGEKAKNMLRPVTCGITKRWSCELNKLEQTWIDKKQNHQLFLQISTCVTKFWCLVSESLIKFSGGVKSYFAHVCLIQFI